ncbi:MAG: Yip1 family protein [Rudaea sp.]
MDFNKYFSRVKNILLTPKTEWPVIAAEPDTVAGLYKNYIIYIASLTPVATFIGLVLFGISIPFVGTIHVGIGPALAQLIFGYAVALAMTYIVALIIDALAPSFGGVKNQTQALKAAAYAWTPVCVVGVLNILPGLGVIVGLLTLVALVYTIYLLNLGLQHTMQTPSTRSAGYTAVVIVIGVVIGFILSFIVGSVTGMSNIYRGGYTNGAIGDTHFEPNNNALGALAAMGARADEANRKMEAAKLSKDPNAQAQAAGAAAGAMLGAMMGGGDQVEALAPDTLKPFLPATLSGLPRTSFEAARNAAMGIQVSNAKATYRNAQGGPEITVEITDSGGAKGFMAIAGFAGMEEDKQTDHGYEKSYHEGGRLVHEEWNSSGSGEYTVILADRFVVEVHGSGVADINALKAAAASVNLAGLEALKGQGVKRG